MSETSLLPPNPEVELSVAALVGTMETEPSLQGSAARFPHIESTAEAAAVHQRACEYPRAADTAASAVTSRSLPLDLSVLYCCEKTPDDSNSYQESI